MEEKTTDEYLRKHAVGALLTDALTQFFLPAANKHNHLPERSAPAHLAAYFDDVAAADHVLLREYEYAVASEHNRLSLLSAVRAAYAQLPQDVLVGTIDETLGLVRLLCPDFPAEIVEKALHLLSQPAAVGEAPPRLTELIRASMLTFYFEDFLGRMAEVFGTCDTRSTGYVNRNVLMLTLQQMVRSRRSQHIICPPVAVFDEVMQFTGLEPEVTLSDAQLSILHAPAMRKFYDTCSAACPDERPRSSARFAAALRLVDPPPVPASSAPAASAGQKRTKRLSRHALRMRGVRDST